MQELYRPTFFLQTLHFATITVKSTIVSETLLYTFIKIISIDILLQYVTENQALTPDLETV